MNNKSKKSGKNLVKEVGLPSIATVIIYLLASFLFRNVLTDAMSELVLLGFSAVFFINLFIAVRNQNYFALIVNVIIVVVASILEFVGIGDDPFTATQVPYAYSKGLFFSIIFLGMISGVLTLVFKFSRLKYK